MKPVWTKVFWVGAVAAAFVSPAAATDYKGSGTATYVVVDSDTVAFAGGAMKQRLRLKGVIVADDPANPINLSAQDCGGSIVVGADGAPVNGAGHCETTDKDGDVWWLSWGDYDGNSNTWTILGGTGKYDGMTGGGKVSVIMQSGDGRSVNRWEGTWTMK